MKLHLSWAATACGLLALCSGCQAPRTTFRGQSLDAATTPAGFSPHHFGNPGHLQEQMYDHHHSTSAVHGGMAWTPSYPGGSFDAGPYYGGMREGHNSPRREQRMMQRGLVPPAGSPYASGYQPTYLPPEDAKPAHTVNGVAIHDGYVGSGRQVGPCPNGCPPPPGWKTGDYNWYRGGCPHCGADFVRHAPTHYHTFSYHRPNDLVYPSPNAVGGATVYSYYTLKGPSDFFRDDERAY